MKQSSTVHVLLKVVEGILTDASRAYPQDECGFRRDMKTVARLAKTRGLGAFTLDLPTLDAHLKLGLKDGRLTFEGALSKECSSKAHVPRLFSGLWLRVFDRNACLLEVPDTTAIFMLRSLCCVGKSIEVACSSDRTQRTIDEYRAIEGRMRLPTNRWQDDDVDFVRASNSVHFCDIVASDIRWDSGLFGSGPTDRRRESRLLSNLQRVCDDFARSIDAGCNPISISCIVSNEAERGRRRPDRGFRHGPGAVAHKGGLVDKYHFPYLSAKLLKTFPRIFFDKMMFGEEPISSTSHELPSVLLAVPKDANKPRLIAVEPVEHQFAQQLGRTFLEREVSKSFLRHFISFDNQNLNKEMAHEGSLCGRLGTVDLSSASDRLSCYTVERAFRKAPGLLRILHSSRTRTCDTGPEHLRGEALKRKGRVKTTRTDGRSILLLRKFATQGTAVTFPVQSIIYALAAISVFGGGRTDEMVRKAYGSVRVFGDDIVVAERRYADLVTLLQLLGLEVNTKKSYNTGLFRESCGGDFYRGDDVTPVKPKLLDPTSPGGRDAAIDYCNLFFSKGLWAASDALRIALGVPIGTPIVHLPSGQKGLWSYVGDYTSHLRYRWNADISNIQYRTRVSSTSVDASDRPWRSSMMKFIHELPHLREDFHSKLELRPATRDRRGWVTLNPSGFKARATRAIW